MSPFVLDASVALAWCLPDERNGRTEQLLRRCYSGYVFVPSLWPTEVTNGLLVAERRKRITPEVSDAFLQRLLRFDIRIQPASVSQDLVLDLARRESLTVYDATYLELARNHSLALATLDTALVRAAAACDIVVL